MPPTLLFRAIHNHGHSDSASLFNVRKLSPPLSLSLILLGIGHGVFFLFFFLFFDVALVCLSIVRDMKARHLCRTRSRSVDTMNSEKVELSSQDFLPFVPSIEPLNLLDIIFQDLGQVK
jgi:hypothetical protein